MQPSDLRRLIEQATSGPWEVSKYGIRAASGYVIDDRRESQEWADGAADLIVALVNAAPALLRLWEAVEAYVNEPGSMLYARRLELHNALNALADPTTEGDTT